MTDDRYARFDYSRLINWEQRLKNEWPFLDEFFADSAVLKRKGSEAAISTPSELYKTMMDFARKGATVQRFKGLGEMNPETLWDTTMDPAKRTILQVNIEEAIEADKTFNMLMGDEVGPRKRFIESHARSANLDV